MRFSIEQNKIKLLNSWYLNLLKTKDSIIFFLIITCLLAFRITSIGIDENILMYRYLMPAYQIWYVLFVIILYSKTEQSPIKNWLKMLLASCVTLSVQFVILGDYEFYLNYGMKYIFLITTISFCLAIFKPICYLHNRLYFKKQFKMEFKPVNIVFIATASVIGTRNARVLIQNDQYEVIRFLLVVLAIAIINAC